MNQDEYIAILFNDCGFDTAKQRTEWMSREFGREIKYSDELYPFEKSLTINALKDIKSGQQDHARAEWKSDE